MADDCSETSMAAEGGSDQLGLQKKEGEFIPVGLAVVIIRYIIFPVVLPVLRMATILISSDAR